MRCVCTVDTSAVISRPPRTVYTAFPRSHPYACLRTFSTASVADMNGCGLLGHGRGTRQHGRSERPGEREQPICFLLVLFRGGLGEVEQFVEGECLCNTNREGHILISLFFSDNREWMGRGG